MDIKDNFNNYHSELSTELENILNFWSTRMVDEENGGFYGRMDGSNKLHPQADKGIVLNARILWTFSAAYDLTHKSEYLEKAKRAKNYILKYFQDKKFGGFFWIVDYQGYPVNTRKQIYAQAFVLYAFAQYYKVSHDREALTMAKDLYLLIEKYSLEIKYGGYLEAFTHDWSSMDDVRLSPKETNDPKIMNTHLHILEAYANLYRFDKSDELEKSLRDLIHIFLQHIINRKTHQFELFFDNEWNVRPHAISFGHDIEGSWLLFEAAEVLGDKVLLKEVETEIMLMVNENIKWGLDTDGGLMYEAFENKVIDSDKHWWPQAEAMVGYFNAFQISGNEMYLSKSIASWEFVKRSIIDRKNGEWYWLVSKDGIPAMNEDKAGLWKCPYHNGRACIEIILRIESLLLKPLN